MTRGGRSAGFILLTVLAVSALFAGLVGALAVVARGAVESVRVDRDRLAADALLDAGITLAAYQLIGLKRPPGEVDGQQIRFDAGVVRLAVTGEGGRVDLNAASPDLLAAAWRAAGRRDLAALTFAARVVDWRDPDDDTEAGAESAAYAAAGLPAPRNGAFRTVGDIASVLGVTADDALALRPFVTVYAPSDTLSAADVPPDLRAALGMSRTGPAAPAAADRGSEAAAQLLSREPSRSFRIRSELLRDGFPAAAVEAVVIPSPTPDALFRTVARWN